jgi:hypothetical protein
MKRGEITDQVRQVAHVRGVSERTVWRWFAAIRAGAPLELLKRQRCAWCGTLLPEQATTRRRFCRPACRTAHHRHQTG